ncbi:inorganic triphosphatase YgiF [Rhodoligotrophos appendicifer]|uniref:CYTH and CHAD domain-containing protein n=1 Tax=Rhodoligotrophos appendicifer TaxID=987056 RepID=UPI00117FFBB8|nr:CYTH and CHAD domain-containing protein [Rhodoligotrophos appendicifer]
MSTETEIKLAVHPEGMAAVEKLFAKDSPILVESTYFDTPDFAFRAKGIQMRVRRDGDQLLQTVKLAGEDGNSALSRAEHEVEIDDAKPNLTHLSLVLPDGIASKLDLTTLQPIFTTKFMRRRHRGGTDGAAEFAYDQGEILGRDGATPISEVEIELKTADVAAYVRACLEFLEQVPAGFIDSGKAARGYRLATAEAPQAYYSSKLALASDMPLPSAIRLMLHHNFSHFLQNISAVRAGVPEGIHQIRVGLRRFRSTVSAFKPVLRTREADAELAAVKAFFNLTGAVRETDVFLAETLPLLVETGMKPRLAEEVTKAAHRYRQSALDKVISALDSTEMARMIISLYGWIEAGKWMKRTTPLDALLENRPVHAFAAPRLRKLHKKLLKMGRAARGSVHVADWHKARISAKKLRYTAEPLLTTLNLDEAEVEQYRDNISAIQGELGRLNDLSVAEDFLKRLIEEAPSKKRKHLKAALDILHQWHLTAEDGFIVEAAKAFRSFEREGFPVRNGSHAK